MFGLGMGEVLIIFAFALIFIGPKKLPGLARGLGKGLREFQRAKDDILEQVSNDMTTPNGVNETKDKDSDKDKDNDKE